MALLRLLIAFKYTTAFVVALVLIATFQACGTGFRPAKLKPDRGLGSQNPDVVEAVAPDATREGPLATISSEYRLPPAVDSEILAGRETELWARVYRPQNLNQGPYPLLVFLHGNHATCGRPSATPGGPRIDDSCQYTTSATCPTGYTVVPNHAGYSYLAELLASWGYIVVSVNANLGITCGAGVAGDNGLNLARGRLILKHLQRLSEWNTSGGTPASLGFDFRNKIDFSQVGLMGHSRGGEGVRAAYNQYRDADSPWPARINAPLTFKAIFEIAPVDGQTSRVLNANGVNWSVLLPLCDGDVSDLSGIRPHDRMLAQRVANSTVDPVLSAIGVWGANHNFYNTEWQQSDASGCSEFQPLWSAGDIGSSSQRQTGLSTIVSFFRANVGRQADEKFNRALDSSFELPEVVAPLTKIGREFTRSVENQDVLHLEDFTGMFPAGKSGLEHSIVNATMSHVVQNPHPVSRVQGRISWEQIGGSVTVNLATAPGLDLSPYKTLDFSVARVFSQRNTTNVPTDFSIQLISSNGAVSASLSLVDYVSLIGPSGVTGIRHSLHESVRLPLKDFTGVNLSQITGVRFVFDKTNSGEILISDIRASKLLQPTQRVRTLLAGATGSFSSSEVSEPVRRVGQIVRIETRVAGMPGVSGAIMTSPTVQIEIFDEQGIPVRNALPELVIGDIRTTFARYGDNGDTKRMIFELPKSDFDQAREGVPVKMQFQESAETWVLELGDLEKSP